MNITAFLMLLLLIVGTLVFFLYIIRDVRKSFDEYQINTEDTHPMTVYLRENVEDLRYIHTTPQQPILVQRVDDAFATTFERLIITPQHILLYEKVDRADVASRYPLESIRGYFPIAVGDTRTGVDLHLLVDARWLIVHLLFQQDGFSAHGDADSASFLRALRSLARMEYFEAYTRKLPYIHLHTKDVTPLQTNEQGDWVSENKQVQLYLNPLYFVVLDASGIAQRVMTLQGIHHLRSMLDEQEPQGILQFRHDDDTFAFRVADVTQWSNALAEAVNRVSDIVG